MRFVVVIVGLAILVNDVVLFVESTLELVVAQCHNAVDRVALAILVTNDKRGK
jgi:hypothetical protein